MTAVPETTVGDVPEMVERVARALCLYDRGKDDDWDAPVYLESARAAIVAMAEPSDLMGAAGLKVWQWQGSPLTTDKCVGDFLAGNAIRWAKPIYRAMIDAALGNTEGAR